MYGVSRSLWTSLGIAGHSWMPYIIQIEADDLHKPHIATAQADALNLFETIFDTKH